MKWQDRYKGKLITVDEAADLVKSGDVVAFPFDHPKQFGLALAKRRDELQNVTLQGLWTEYYPWFERGWEESFRVVDYFSLRNTTRQGVRERRIDWAPWIPGLSSDASRRENDPERGTVCLYADVYVCKITPPNKNGYCSLGASVWYSPSAIRTAKTVIAEVDPDRIWTYGDLVHVSELDYLIERPGKESQPPELVPFTPEDEAQMASVIGTNISSLIRDGDTIQVGGGTPSEAAVEFLNSRNDLALDSEMINVGMIALVRSGVVTGKRRNIHPGKVICTNTVLYPGDPRNSSALRFLDQNPTFEFRDASYVLNIPRIAANDNMVSINTAVAIDLTGQIVIDHLGPVPLSGTGGQVEYTVAAHYARGGRSITALLSNSKQGTLSRIVPQLESGTMTHISCGFVDYLITEYGIVNLEAKTRRQRAEAIISIAHPDFQPELRKAARKLFYP